MKTLMYIQDTFFYLVNLLVVTLHKQCTELISRILLVASVAEYKSFSKKKRSK